NNNANNNLNNSSNNTDSSSSYLSTEFLPDAMLLDKPIENTGKSVEEQVAKHNIDLDKKYPTADLKKIIKACFPFKYNLLIEKSKKDVKIFDISFWWMTELLNLIRIKDWEAKKQVLKFLLISNIEDLNSFITKNYNDLKTKQDCQKFI